MLEKIKDVAQIAFFVILMAMCGTLMYYSANINQADEVCKKHFPNSEYSKSEGDCVYTVKANNQ